jgi:hypothetical protein
LAPHSVSIAGGSDELPDEATVRQQVRRLLGSILPHFNDGTLVAASCIVPHNCAICGGGIKPGEQEIEIVSRTGAVKIFLHRRCFEIWGEEASAEHAPPKLP